MEDTMRHNATQRVICFAAALVLLAGSTAGEPHGPSRPVNELLAVQPESATLLAPSVPRALAARPGLLGTRGLQLDSKAGLQYHTRLGVGDANWVLRVKGPLLRRKRLGLGFEVKF